MSFELSHKFVGALVAAVALTFPPLVSQAAAIAVEISRDRREEEGRSQEAVASRIVNGNAG